MDNEDIVNELKGIKKTMNDIGINNMDINYRLNLLILKLENKDEFYFKLINLYDQFSQQDIQSKLTEECIALLNQIVEHIRTKNEYFLKLVDLTDVKYHFQLESIIGRIKDYIKEYVLYMQYDWK